MIGIDFVVVVLLVSCFDSLLIGIVLVFVGGGVIV